MMFFSNRLRGRFGYVLGQRVAGGDKNCAVFRERQRGVSSTRKP